MPRTRHRTDLEFRVRPTHDQPPAATIITLYVYGNLVSLVLCVPCPAHRKRRRSQRGELPAVAHGEDPSWNSAFQGEETRAVRVDPRGRGGSGGSRVNHAHRVSASNATRVDMPTGSWGLQPSHASPASRYPLVEMAAGPGGTRKELQAGREAYRAGLSARDTCGVCDRKRLYRRCSHSIAAVFPSGFCRVYAPLKVATNRPRAPAATCFRSSPVRRPRPFMKLSICTQSLLAHSGVFLA